VADDDLLTINLVGDLYFTRENPETIFDYCLESLRSADVIIGNLEVPLADRGSPSTKWVGSKNMRSRPHAIQALKAAGFTAVSLANNHMMDWGGEALEQTIEILDGAGIGHAGAGADRAAAFAPQLIEQRGIRIGLLAFTSVFWPEGYGAGDNRPGMATVKVNTTYTEVPYGPEQPATPAVVKTEIVEQDLADALNAIRELRKTVDIVIVSWHWGVAHGYGKLVEYQVELGHAAIDAGADLVFGHHPHQPQGIEVYKGRLIAYSLSNAAWDAPKADRQAMIIRCRVGKAGVKDVAVIPTWATSRMEPQALSATSWEGAAVIARLTELSNRFGTCFVPRDDLVMVASPTVVGS